MTGPATKRFILCFGSMTCFASLLEVTNKSHRLVPTFRSSYTISAITFYELRKPMGTSKFMVLVPLFDLKVPGFISPLAVQGLQIDGTRPLPLFSFAVRRNCYIRPPVPDCGPVRE